MADVARDDLDRQIFEADTAGKMLTHLADAIDAGPAQRGGETYQRDAIQALEYGAQLARDRKVNLLHVAYIYDAKVAGG